MNPISRLDISDTFAGTGAELPVVLLHGTAADPTSWTGLREFAGPRLEMSAPDLAGYTAAPSGRRADLSAIAEAVARDVLAPGRPVHLVGHDFGAVLAMKIAAARPGQVAGLTLIEPTAYNAVLPDDGNAGQIRREMSATARTMRVFLEEGDAGRAMEHFTDFVNGPGTWARTSVRHRQALARYAGQALAELRAIAADQMSAADLAGIVCPVLLVRGSRTRRSLRQVATGLRRSVPFVRDEVIGGAAHFPHLSDPHVVCPLVVDFLVQVESRWQDTGVAPRQAA